MGFKKYLSVMRNLSSGRKSRSPRIIMNGRQKMRIRQKMTLIGSAALSLLVVIGVIVYFQFSSPQQGRAAVAGDYRSKVTGNWSSTSTWEKYNGSSWVAATATPSNADGVIE